MLEELLTEAEFYQINGLMDLLKEEMKISNNIIIVETRPGKITSTNLPLEHVFETKFFRFDEAFKYLLL
jgi:hypothetical protein